jgi:hypothetical protein
MALESELSVFLVGAGGGAANELLHWWNLRENPHLPDYARSFFYWIVTAGMVALGGGLAWLQLGAQAEPVLAFEIGLATPLILQRLAQAKPTPTGAMGSRDRPSLFDFLSG